MFLLASRNVYLHLFKVFVDQTRPCIPKVLLLAAMRSSHLFFHSHNRSYAHNYTFLYIVLIHCVLNYSRLRGGNSCLILRSLGMCIAAITVPLRILTHCEILYLRLVVYQRSLEVLAFTSLYALFLVVQVSCDLLLDISVTPHLLSPAT